MSEPIRDEIVEIQQRRVRLLSRGSGDRVVLLLHTGASGSSPFCGSSDLFADLMGALELDGFRLVAPDLPGAGGTELRGVEDLLVDGLASFIEGVVGSLFPVQRLHLVAHGQISLAALRVARETPVASCFLIAPNSAAPIGDSIQNVALLDPPAPLWTLRSQRWAVRRLAYVPDRVPSGLIDRMVENAAGEPHRTAAELMRAPATKSALFGSQLRAHDQFYAYCRDTHYSLPLNIFWGAQDPTASVERGAVLTEILSGGPSPLQLDLVNQCGHFAQFDRQYQLARALEMFVRRARPGQLATSEKVANV
jgi:pimeloyl-ACP methyl ester carboxylesterase